MRKSFRISFFTFFLIFWGATLFAQKDEASLEKIYNDALKSFDKNDYQQGYKLLDECLKQDSLWHKALYARAFYQLQEGKNQEAERSFSKIIRYYPTDIDGFLGRAEARANQQRFPQAFKDLEKALKMDSTHLGAIYQMAFTHFKADNPKMVQAYLDKGLTYAPENIQFLLLKALTYQTYKEFSQAENILQKVLKKEPENIEAQKIKAVIAYERGSYKDAIRTYEQILKKNPNAFTEEDFYYWSMALYKTKSYKQALSIIQSIKEIQNSELYYVQALCLFQQKKYTEAWEAMQNAEKLDDSFPAEFYYDKAIMAHYAKKAQSARENYLKALVLMPEIYLLRNDKDEKVEVLMNANSIFQREFSQKFLDSVLVTAYQERSLNVLENDKTNEALKDIEKALAIDSLNSKSYTIRGITYALMGKFQDANRDFEKAEKLPKERDLGYLYLMRGLAAAEAQNIGQAVFYLDKAISHSPLQANYYAEKAHLLFEIGDTEGAFKCIDKAIVLAPKEVDYRLDKINFLHEEERYDDLLKECERVLEIEPDAVQVYYFRGMAHWAKKNKTQARKDLEFFLQYYPDDKDAQKALKLLD